MHVMPRRPPGGGVEGQPPYVVKVPVCDEHCLVEHSALGAAPYVKGNLGAGQKDARLLHGNSGGARGVQLVLCGW